MRPRVVFVIRQLGIGGTERRLLDLRRALSDRMRISVLVLTPGGALAGPCTRSAPETGTLGRLTFLARRLAKLRPELVHAWDLASGFYAKTALRLTRQEVPLVSGLGASRIESWRVRSLLRRGWLLPDFFVTNSRAGEAVLRKSAGSDIPIRVIDNGIDGQRIAHTGPPPGWALEGRLVVGHIGKFDQRKRADRMVDVAARTVSSPEAPLFVIFGDGPQLAATRARVAANPVLTARVRLMGEQPEAPSLARFFDIGVLCSDTEGFPNVLLELMASGVPAISSDVGDAARVLDHGRAGYLVEAGDLSAMAAKIERLLEDPAERARLAAVGRSRYEERFTLERMSREHADLYRQLDLPL